MEGSESLRQRGIHKKADTGTPPKDPNSLDDSSPAPEGDNTAEMAAGSARIIRYVLIAFFVSGIALNTTMSIVNCPIRVS